MWLLLLLIDAYSLVIFLSVILSWLPLGTDHPVVRLIRRLTEPVLGPLRQVVPSLGGFDFSPMLLLLGLRMLRRVLAGH